MPLFKGTGAGAVRLLVMVLAVGAKAFMPGPAYPSLSQTKPRGLRLVQKTSPSVRAVGYTFLSAQMKGPSDEESPPQKTRTRRLTPSFGEAMSSQDFCGVIVTPATGAPKQAPGSAKQASEGARTDKQVTEVTEVEKGQRMEATEVEQKNAKKDAGGGRAQLGQENESAEAALGTEGTLTGATRLIQQGYAALQRGRPQDGLDLALQARSILQEELLAPPGDEAECVAKAEELERKCARVNNLYASGKQALSAAQTALDTGALDQARSECDKSIWDYDAALEEGAADLGQPARDLLIVINGKQAANGARAEAAGLIQRGYAALQQGRPQDGLDLALQARSILQELLAPTGDDSVDADVVAKAEELERKCLLVRQLYASGKQKLIMAQAALDTGALDQARRRCDKSITDYDAALEEGTADLGQPARDLLIVINGKQAAKAQQRLEMKQVPVVTKEASEAALGADKALTDTQRAEAAGVKDVTQEASEAALGADGAMADIQREAAAAAGEQRTATEASGAAVGGDVFTQFFFDKVCMFVTAGPVKHSKEQKSESKEI